MCIRDSANTAPFIGAGQWSGWTGSSVGSAWSGLVASAGVWNAELTSTQISSMYDLGPKGDWYANFSSNLQGWWAFGNHNDKQITGGTTPSDTISVVYDRSRNGRNANVKGITGGSYGSANTSKIRVLTSVSQASGHPAGMSATIDSSSANSIHHAVVAGGGMHHTKAVTLKSDGTNAVSYTHLTLPTILLV